ncbi:class I SAM-dependent methyltransferase [Qingshengfaniella alkalisoli]|uniref:Methyltransferase domain-containing protein n=1 Tax=Qingshengfaniella alkalisoli TaxID=2599296 RepID=A0A5B8ITA2_9RHOB|nr:class I SAM-dependent methyltransferase [Qingshengfaniella alkalisoli]QDY68673.1 methyltransferase domain-containing protein [Qingshengfaniella alkalisoli]
MPVSPEQITAHYDRGGVLQAILDGLRAAGHDPDGPLSIEDLAPVDEFHTAGRIATLKLLDHLRISPTHNVLDIGSGLGGTARCIASQTGADVTGVDLTPGFVEIATDLSRRTGLNDKCHFQQGSATELPVADDSFDFAVSLHVAMNIEDRPKMYSEIARVLHHGGTVGLFDVMKGQTAGMRYPVPWAETSDTSFLISADETAYHLRQQGFTIASEQNLRDFAIGYFDDLFAAQEDQDAPPPLGLHLLTGDNAKEKFENYVAALKDHQIEPVIITATLSN